MNDGEGRAAGRPGVRAYQVHIEGHLSRTMIRYLAWPSRIQEGQSHLHVQAGPEDLADLLESCSASGLVVDRVTRLRP